MSSFIFIDVLTRAIYYRRRIRYAVRIRDRTAIKSITDAVAIETFVIKISNSTQRSSRMPIGAPFPVSIYEHPFWSLFPSLPSLPLPSPFASIHFPPTTTHFRSLSSRLPLLVSAYCVSSSNMRCLTPEQSFELDSSSNCDRVGTIDRKYLCCHEEEFCNINLSLTPPTTPEDLGKRQHSPSMVFVVPSRIFSMFTCRRFCVVFCLSSFCVLSSSLSLLLFLQLDNLFHLPSLFIGNPSNSYHNLNSNFNRFDY